MTKSVVVIVLLTSAVFSFESNDTLSGLFIFTKGEQLVEIGLAQLSTAPKSPMYRKIENAAVRPDGCPGIGDLSTARAEGPNELYEKLVAERDVCRDEFVSGLLRRSMADGEDRFQEPTPHRDTVAVVVISSRKLSSGEIERYLWILPVNLGLWFLDLDTALATMLA